MTGQSSGETVYYSAGKVKVTSSRFIVGNVTYSLAQITSVALKRTPAKTGDATGYIVGNVIHWLAQITSVAPKRTPAKIGDATGFIIGGLITGFIGLAKMGGPDLGIAFAWLAVGVVLVAAAWVLLKQAKDTYAAQITTAAGETKALTSHDKGVISPVVDALNQAIIDRG